MREKPANYGMWWDTNNLDDAWYRQIFESRRPIHEHFMSWVQHTDEVDGRLETVLEVGCGRGVAYPDFFRGRQYTGFDISPKEVAWCQAHLAEPGRTFAQGDFVLAQDRPADRFDLVFSHAVIDHIYDIDAFLAACVHTAKRWVYLSAYRGWHPLLRDHKYLWDPVTTCFYNDLSPDRLREQLARLGCTQFEVHALATGRTEIPLETAIVAKVS